MIVKQTLGLVFLKASFRTARTNRIPRHRSIGPNDSYFFTPAMIKIRAHNSIATPTKQGMIISFQGHLQLQ